MNLRGQAQNPGGRGINGECLPACVTLPGYNRTCVFGFNMKFGLYIDHSGARAYALLCVLGHRLLSRSAPSAYNSLRFSLIYTVFS